MKLRISKILVLLLCIVVLFGCGKKEDNQHEDDSHTHTFYSHWEYDNTYHYHQASCEHQDVVEKFIHEFDQGTTINATYDEDGYIIYKCKTCNFSKSETLPKLEHKYRDELSFDDKSHYYLCIDEGYEDLRKDEQSHDDAYEKIITPSTTDTVGLAEYTCSICNHTYQKELLIKIEVFSLPTVQTTDIYVGMKLKDVILSGGSASVDGVFRWKNEEEIITTSTSYEIEFVPNENNKYATITFDLNINAKELYIDIKTSANGTASELGITNVYYNGELTIDFFPNDGYTIKEIIVDGKTLAPALSYTFTNILENHTLEVIFDVEQSLDNYKFKINCLEGTMHAYVVDGTTIKFTNIQTDSVYSISGEIEGNIIIDVGDNYKFDLEMHGLTITSTVTNPITILSGSEVSLTAKKGYENYIYDKRSKVDETLDATYSGAIISFVDLEICGKGSLVIESTNNNGIHSKKDLQVKNLTLEVNVCDNSLKGNDSVEIKDANTTLISRQGDTIKTTNSDISEKGNQRGIISITGGTHNLYAACDGIDAAYDVIIDGEETTLNIYTDKYSSYSDEVTTVVNEEYYVRYSSNAYKYSIKYYNSESDYLWVNAEYYTSVFGGRNTYYYYKFAKHSEYQKLIVYMYSSSQQQGQETSYYKKSDALTLNSNYDTIAFSNRTGTLKTEWTNYSSTPVGPGGPGGGMNEGNSDKGTYSTKGIKADNSITINNGTLNIKSYDDSIHANCDVVLENGANPTGNVTINGGNLNIYSNDDGLHADGTLTINKGSIMISNSYEGIEGSYVIIAGGNIAITSNDDGINATATSGQTIVISDGELYLFAKGDGIDSNSTTSYNGIVFSGGNTVVISASNGNSAIDSERGYAYTGGKVLVVTSSGGMSSESTNCSNFSSIGKKVSMSLSTTSYINVTVNNSLIGVVKMPCSLSAIVIYLGSSTASITTSTSTQQSVNTSGVYWNKN